MVRRKSTPLARPQTEVPKAIKASLDDMRKAQSAGDLVVAAEICIRSIELHPTDYVLRRMMADILFQQKDYKRAFVALGDFLACIPPSRKLILEFARRYRRFRRVLPAPEMNLYAQILRSAIGELKVNRLVASSVRQIISAELATSQISEIGDIEHSLLGVIDDDVNFDAFVKIERHIEETDGLARIAPLLDKFVLNRSRVLQTYKIDLYCVSIYEKLKHFDSASKILRELLALRIDSVAVRTLFRVSRLRKDYAPVDELLEVHPDLVRASDFNILYELVYYFEEKNDFDSLQSALRTLDRGFSSNLPVTRTVRNFYIRFGMLEDAKRLEDVISALYQRRRKGAEDGKYIAEVVESETELASKVQELYSQLEHQKQLAAISDLTTGISHELGQPITNIRYTIQFYKRIFEKQITKENVEKVFSSILEETERMGGLIRRLSPLTSSRSVEEEFDVIDRINKRVQAENPKLTENSISTTVRPKHSIFLIGDPVKFDQLVTNLLLNSIDAITEKGLLLKPEKGHSIDFNVESGARELRMFVSDTGIGVPIANRNKIFDPFFSTKAPGKGEGLGLFIVWNLLKMLGGRITVDAKYKNGARFIATLPKSV